jgi:hypothetical protein
MGVVGWLIRVQARRRRGALAVLALVTALGTTGTLVAAGASDRTADAYGAYRQRASVGDVEINPSLATAQVDAAIRALPGVEDVTSDGLFLAAIDPDPRPRTQAELDAEPLSYVVKGSFDGRFQSMDRPAVAEGRLPAGSSEVFVSADIASTEHLRVGDVVQLSFWARSTELSGITDAVPPVGVEQATVAGIGALPDDVLPDGLYLQGTMIISPDLARRYDCLPELAGQDASADAALASYTTATCATTYRFWSLRLTDGDAGVPAVLQAFSEAAAGLNATIPTSIADEATYALVGASTTAALEQRVERSTDPIVVALGVLAAAAGAVTLLVVGLGVARELGRADDDQRMWWRLGLARPERVAVLLVPVLLAIGVGLGLGAFGAWLASPAGPVGSVRSIEPRPSRELSGTVALVALAVAVALAVVATAIAWQAVRRVTRPVGAYRSSVARVLVRRSTRPEVAEGVRAAYRSGRGAGVVLASGAVAVGVFVAAVVFGASLSRVLSTPSAYGWHWDIATIDNYGYGGIQLPAVHASLDGRPEIERWTALGFSTSVLLDGDQIAALFAWDRSSTVDLTVVDGTLPHAADEVAIGARTADDRGLHVGDTVAVQGYEVDQRSATVTGIVVLPALGPFRSDRTAPGVGLLVPEAMLNEDAIGLGPTFVGMDLRAGADRQAVLDGLRDDILDWFPDSDINTFDRTTPARPPEIVDARSMRESPMLVGALLVVGATVGLVVAITVSVRARRRDLAVLRVLGFTDHQLRRSVLVQAVVSVVGAMVVGLPLGIATGRVAWREFASRLGVLTRPHTPVVWVVATVVGAGVLALLAGALPARSAAKTRPAVTLRTE